jgi:hypothetical protein
MSLPLIEVLAIALVAATLVLFVLIAHDLGDDYRSIDRRLDRLDARRAERRKAQLGKVPIPVAAERPTDRTDDDASRPAASGRR